jgi:predicted ATPase
MHIRRIAINGIRSISELDWKLPNGSPSAGWHVVIGDNGSGKSTFLRAIALALIGPAEPGALRQDWGSWLPPDATEAGTVRLDVSHEAEWDEWSEKGRPGRATLYPTVTIKRDSPVAVLEPSKDAILKRTIWLTRKPGWFSAGYGPFRRFEGGDPESSKGYYAYPKVGRHLSVFGENVALTECLQWLRTLKHRQLEQSDPYGFFDRVKSFINKTGMLPYSTNLEDASADEVKFVDGNGYTVPITLLGDGFRAILSMTFELIRQLQDAYGAERIFSDDQEPFVRPPGVVLIDEVDAHLHPSWQRSIGSWFTKHFPNMQFIVTTHSPLVCWSATEGTIFRLPPPGAEELGRMIEGEDRKRLINGTVLDAYGTELFGVGVSRSAEAQGKVELLGELNLKKIHQGLSPEEAGQVEHLKAELPSSAYTATPPPV